jgi:hypothetical protein
MKIQLLRVLLPVFIAVVACGRAAAATPGGANILTYHYDNLRTGWNQAETVLTTTNVNAASFGLLRQVALDEQVDAQPLFVSNQTISGQGQHDVVYVATENNTIYAIDPGTGAVLLSRNLGTPVPITALPMGCNNNSNNVGINSTPVIDLSTGTLYVVTYTFESSVPTFRIHALNLSTLQDQTPDVLAGGANTLKNGKPIHFVSANNRQRPALLEANGNIYAAFGSWCDLNSNVSRGWVLGWSASNLSPLPSSKLNNQRAKSPDDFFQTSVWMSGYGLAADVNGSIYFATANSDYDGKTWNPTYNLSESVVKLSGDLGSVQGYYTPSGTKNGWRTLDEMDYDFGAGGVLLLPDQAGTYPHLAIAAGKTGPMYLLNRDNLGGLGSSKITLGTYQNRRCWCGPSYYVGADGISRVVESSGNEMDVWKIVTSPSTGLAFDVSNFITYGQNSGFFTSISSNGATAGSHIIWAVTRPVNSNPADVALQAFDPANGAYSIYVATAGTWPFVGGNSNIVPVVANGYVFVATYANLSIFGLTGGSSGAPLSFHAPVPPEPVLFVQAPHVIYGIVKAMKGNTLTLQARGNREVTVDTGKARAASDYAASVLGEAAVVLGDYRNGTLVARAVMHAKQDQGLWGRDR